MLETPTAHIIKSCIIGILCYFTIRTPSKSKYSLPAIVLTSYCPLPLALPENFSINTYWLYPYLITIVNTNQQRLYYIRATHSNYLSSWTKWLKRVDHKSTHIVLATPELYNQHILSKSLFMGPIENIYSTEQHAQTSPCQLHIHKKQFQILCMAHKNSCRCYISHRNDMFYLTPAGCFTQ